MSDKICGADSPTFHSRLALCVFYMLDCWIYTSHGLGWPRDSLISLTRVTNRLVAPAGRMSRGTVVEARGLKCSVFQPRVVGAGAMHLRQVFTIDFR